MPRTLPPLRLLLAFEATARQQSFTRAATELNLTQTAISHRIKELETLLSVRLFTRNQKYTRLTTEGRSYLELIRPALTQIAAATERVTSIHDNRLTIACLYGFSEKCLTPALPAFISNYPEIGLRLIPLSQTLRLPHDDFDVAISYGHGEWGDFEATRIGRETIYPVCIPSLLSSGRSLNSPEDIINHTAIRTSSPLLADDWTAWLKLAGLQIESFPNELFCESLSFAMHAISQGLGIGLGRSMLVKEDIRCGRLVAPFDISYEPDAGYHLLVSRERCALPKVQAFKQWLLSAFDS